MGVGLKEAQALSILSPSLFGLSLYLRIID